jgi:hypothetical protein
LRRGRNNLGVPTAWNEVNSWFVKKKLYKLEDPGPLKAPDKKYPQIKKLHSYKSPPDDKFWHVFPYRPLPSKVHSRVDHSALRSLILMNRRNLTVHQFRRGMKIAEDLQFGAEAYQKSVLPPITVENTESAYEHGELLTDKIASWIDAGFVVGPFSSPPMPGFRANMLMAVVRNEAVRPIINLSEPKGFSFNDNVDKCRIEKVSMATAKSFSYAVRKAGVGSSMSKFDLRDAYKIVPVKKQDWKLQGFKWLHKYFIETQLIFGAGPSVANFDRLAKTLVDLTCARCSVLPYLVCRTLDDIPVVSPKNSGWTEEFSEELKKICKEIGVPLADNCPEKVKAFENTSVGTVLGIRFNTDKMEWSLPERKADKLLRRIDRIIESQSACLVDVRSLMGSVNDFAQMCPFLGPFKVSGNQFLASFSGNEGIALRVPLQVKRDLLVCANAVVTARKGLPIAKEPCPPGLNALQFYTDAAGAKYALCRGKRVPLELDDLKGVAGIGLKPDGSIWWWSRLFWSFELLHRSFDSKGAHFGNKMSTLEAIGILLPLLSVPEKLLGRELVFFVDNISVMYGWENNGLKNDITATIILRAVSLIAAYLGAEVHVMHIPRLENKWAEVADSLTRQKTSSNSVFAILGEVPESRVKGALEEWIEHPAENWELPEKLLEEVMNRVQLE